MNNNIKIILVIICTFTAALFTSLLLELKFFQVPERRILINAFILIQLYLGFIIFKSMISIKK
jgi:hypothetical protein